MVNNSQAITGGQPAHSTDSFGPAHSFSSPVLMKNSL